MITWNKRLTLIVTTIALLLLIPLIAMQFTNEVNWNFFDFMVAGALLLATGCFGELVIRKVEKTQHRIIIGIAILAALLMVWAELAVGIFGTPIGGS